MAPCGTGRRGGRCGLVLGAGLKEETMPRGDDACAQQGRAELAEQDLIRRSRAGDQVAFAELITRYRVLIYAVSRRVTGHDADAEDAVQETLHAAWRGLHRFDGRSAVSTWLYRIAHNEAVDIAHRSRRAPLPVAILPEQPDRQTVDRQVLDWLSVEMALSQVPSAFRAAVALRDLGGLSYEEITTELGIRIDTVKSRISRGRCALRALLGDAVARANKA